MDRQDLSQPRILARQEIRAHRRRKEGTTYKLRVIRESGGLLELVEEEAPRHWFVEWARVMQHNPWNL